MREVPDTGLKARQLVAEDPDHQRKLFIMDGLEGQQFSTMESWRQVPVRMSRIQFPMVVSDQKATPFDVLPEHPGRVSAHSRRGDGYRPVMLRQVSEELGDGRIASKFLPPELLDWPVSLKFLQTSTSRSFWTLSNPR